MKQYETIDNTVKTGSIWEIPVWLPENFAVVCLACVTSLYFQTYGSLAGPSFCIRTGFAG